MDCARKSLERGQEINGRGDPLVTVAMCTFHDSWGHHTAERNTAVPESHRNHPAEQGSVGDAGNRFGHAGYGSSNGVTRRKACRLRPFHLPAKSIRSRPVATRRRPTRDRRSSNPSGYRRTACRCASTHLPTGRYDRFPLAKAPSIAAGFERLRRSRSRRTRTRGAIRQYPGSLPRP